MNARAPKQEPDKSANIIHRVTMAAFDDLNNRIAGFLEARYGKLPRLGTDTVVNPEAYREFFEKNHLTLRSSSTNGIDYIYTIREKGRKVFEVFLTRGIMKGDSNNPTVTVKTGYSVLRRGMKAAAKKAT